MKTHTEKNIGLIGLQVPAEGTCGIYATDDGFVQIVSEHDGVKRILEFAPEEWDAVALGGIKLGVIARNAVEAKKVQVPQFELPPKLADALRRNGKRK
jgi:hypothetical protein